MATILNDFSSTTISPTGEVSGFTQPFGLYPDWGLREGRLRTFDTSTEAHKLLLDAQIPEFVDGEVTALTCAYFYENMNKPTGRHRTVGIRMSSTQKTGVFLSLLSLSRNTYADPTPRIVVQVHQLVNGVETVLGEYTTQWPSHAGDLLMRFRMRSYGSRVYVKAWSDVFDEPTSWDAVVETTVTGPGRAGIAAMGTCSQEFVWLGISDEPGVPAPLGPSGAFPVHHADFTSFHNLVESMCFPVYGAGDVVNPNSRTDMQHDWEKATDGYRSARTRSLEISRRNNLPYPSPEDTPMSYAHCSRFSGTLILNTIDPFFCADLTEWQNDFMNAYMNGWVAVMTGETYDKSRCKPGDVWVTRRPGHVFVWVGDMQGHDDVIAEGSYAALPSTSARVGSMRKFYLDPVTGRDHINRAYTAWRFVGRPQRQLLLQRPDGLELMQAYQQTVSDIEQRVL